MNAKQNHSYIIQYIIGSLRFRLQVRHFPEVPGFREAINDFSMSCYRLSERLLTLIAIGLGLDVRSI